MRIAPERVSKLGDRVCSWPILVLAVILAGCGQDSPPRSEVSTGKKSVPRPRIALVMKSLANEFFATMAEGARGQQRRHSDADPNGGLAQVGATEPTKRLITGAVIVLAVIADVHRPRQGWRAEIRSGRP